MTQDEAIEEIISENKFYIGVMPQNKAYYFVQSYKAGTAKQKSINEFLTAFGYEIKTPAQWIKK